jgi:capsular polysaccharide biosynthesis protein
MASGLGTDGLSFHQVEVDQASTTSLRAGVIMIKIIVAFLAGMFVATVGISGVASAVDKAVGKTQEVMKETVK